MAKKKGLSAKIETEVCGGQEDVKLAERIQKTRSRSKSYTLDLRIHSPASLGYMDVEGIDIAPAIVRLAKVKGLDVIGVTDFYSGHFVDSVIEAARESNLKVIPGVDLRCRLGACDDVIISCFFPEDFGSTHILELLNELNIPASAFGNRSYIVSAEFSDVLALVDKHHGVVLPSRMDKTPHRRSVLPILVEQYGFRAFDLAYADSKDFFKKHWPKHKFQLFSFSNANALAQVGSRIAKVKMTEEGFAGVRNLVARVG